MILPPWNLPSLATWTFKVQQVQQINNRGPLDHIFNVQQELLFHLQKCSFSQCLCGLWHLLHLKGRCRGVLTEKEVLERAFRALDELAGKH
jgi:hypothetical protein